jgi:hypothetical protein
MGFVFHNIILPRIVAYADGVSSVALDIYTMCDIVKNDHLMVLVRLYDMAYRIDASLMVIFGVLRIIEVALRCAASLSRGLGQA